MRTKLQKINTELLSNGEGCLKDNLEHYTRLGHSAGTIASLFEVSTPTVRKWFRELQLEGNKYPAQAVKLNNPTGNPDLMRAFGKQKASILQGVNIPERERELKLARGTVGRRLKRGWPIQKALTFKRHEAVKLPNRKKETI